MTIGVIRVTFADPTTRFPSGVAFNPATELKQRDLSMRQLPSTTLVPVASVPANQASYDIPIETEGDYRVNIVWVDQQDRRSGASETQVTCSIGTPTDPVSPPAAGGADVRFIPN